MAESEAVTSLFKCQTCGKEFKSAQALGGHKRSHILSAKEQSALGKKAAAKRYGKKKSKRKYGAANRLATWAKTKEPVMYGEMTPGQKDAFHAKTKPVSGKPTLQCIKWAIQTLESAGLL